MQPTLPKPAHGATPLIYAVWTGNLETIGRLRARGASITAKDRLGGFLAISPMELAVFLHDVEVAKALAQAGAEVNEVDETGISLLTGAVIANDVPMARALIALGARVNLVDDRSMTALMHAASVDFGIGDAGTADRGRRKYCDEIEGRVDRAGHRPQVPATTRWRASCRRRLQPTDPDETQRARARRSRGEALTQAGRARILITQR